MDSPGAPSVIIVGAGLGGLMLGILLERAKIEYTIFERAPKIKPLGSCIALGPNILPLFEQIGIFKEFEAISKSVDHISMYRAEDMHRIGAVDIEEHIERSGYSSMVCSRPDLYDLLLSRIPKEKIHLGKRVLSITQGEHAGGMIRCADGMTCEADIIVGADGAYSAVRQSLYQKLDSEGKLPKSDGTKMAQDYINMVGTTGPLDLEKYPMLGDKFSHADWHIGPGPFTWSYFSIPGNRISWTVGAQVLTPELMKESDTSRLSEWGPETAQALCEQVKDFGVAVGGTLEDLFEATPKEMISKVVLEEKLFKTWHHERTVLIGDACHKILPYAGQGAVNAMEDAVVLANALYEIRSATHENIMAAFKSYRSQRYPHAAEQLDASKIFAILLAGKTWYENLFRRFVLNFASDFFQRHNYAKTLNYRPQASFLPMIPNKGKIPVLAQKPSKRYLEDQALISKSTLAAVL